MPEGTVVVCEPQCHGFEHASFNAALLETVREAFPGSQIVCIGESGHLDYIQADLAEMATEATGMSWESMRIPCRRQAGWGRLVREIPCYRTAIEMAEAMRAVALVFCSITGTGLLALKALMALYRTNVPTLAVVHASLREIRRWRPRQPWRWPVAMRQVLRLPHPPSLQLVVLGESILREIHSLLPSRAALFRSIDMPYLWPSERSATPRPRPDERRPLHFVLLGYAGKGIDRFNRIAGAVAASPEEACFSVVGFDRGTRMNTFRHIQPISTEPLSRPAFARMAHEADYCVWTADPDTYRLAASATFLDAMAFTLPGIYLRNPYVEHYADRLGDIGYLCDSEEVMAKTIRRLIANFPTDQYFHQVETIRKGRTLFEPRQVARDLRRHLQLPGIQGAPRRWTDDPHHRPRANTRVGV